MLGGNEGRIKDKRVEDYFEIVALLQKEDRAREHNTLQPLT